MSERPILFSGPMVQALLDGRKTQTRRIVRIPEIVRSEDADLSLTTMAWCDQHESGPGFYAWMTEYPDEGSAPVPCPYGIPGDRLWVREAFFYRSNKTAVVYKADFSTMEAAGVGALYGGWKPSIHMPRWASRITLEITEVRVQRVQEISEEDAIAEGITIKPDAEIAARVAGDTPARMEFWALWSSINGPDSWAANPWVWALSFKRVKP